MLDMLDTLEEPVPLSANTRIQQIVEQMRQNIENWPHIFESMQLAIKKGVSLGESRGLKDLDSRVEAS